VPTIIGLSGQGEPEYDGTTTIFWDDQTTVVNDKDKIVYLDEAGEQWTFDQLTPIEELERANYDNG